MFVLRHRSASGLVNRWELAHGRIVATIRLGSAEPVEVEFDVCRRPIGMAHPILRIDGESWRVLPTVYLAHVSVSRDRDRTRLVQRDCRGPVACELHRMLVEHVILTNTPPDVDEWIESLA